MGGAEGKKLALGSGVLDLTVKLLNTRNPVPVRGGRRGGGEKRRERREGRGKERGIGRGRRRERGWNGEEVDREGEVRREE